MTIKELKAIITENAEGAEAGSAQAQIAVVNAEAELDKQSRLSHSSRTTLTDWEKKVLKQLAPVRRDWDNGLFDSPEEARWRSEERNWGVEDE